MINATELAVTLNEGMPISFDGYTYVRAEEAPQANEMHAMFMFNENGGFRCVGHHMLIGILWAECVQRGWQMSVGSTTTAVMVFDDDGVFKKTYREYGTDVLALCRAFAKAKAEGGAA